MKYFLAIFLFIPCWAIADDLQEVTIRDSNFEIVKHLTSPSDLKTFSEIWEKRTKAECNKKDLRFKLDIKPGDRWLYSLDGCATVLTMKAGAAAFRISDVDNFNKLLGVDGSKKENSSK